MWWIVWRLSAPCFSVRRWVAVCHDHKYDPFTQKDFYALFAYFNSLDANPLDGNKKDPAPVIRVYSDDQRAKLEEAKQAIVRLETQMRAPMPDLDAAQAQWEAAEATRQAERWRVAQAETQRSTGGSTLTRLEDHSILASGENPSQDTYHVVTRTDQTGLRAVRLEALTHESLPNQGAGRASNSNFVLSDFALEAVSVADPTKKVAVRWASASGDYEQKDFLISHAIDADPATGWAVDGNQKRENRSAIFVAAEPFGFPGGTELRFRLAHESPHGQHAIGRFRLALTADESAVGDTQPVVWGGWHELGPYPAATAKDAFNRVFEPEVEVDLGRQYVKDLYKAGKWRKRDQYKDGAVQTIKTRDNAATYLYRTIESPSRREVDLSLGSDDTISVWINGRRMLHNESYRGAAADQEKLTLELNPGTNHLLMKIVNGGGASGFYFKVTGERVGGLPQAVVAALGVPALNRNADQTGVVRDYYRRDHWPQWRDLDAQLIETRRREQELANNVPTSLVASEMKDPKQAFVLLRGQYDQKGDPVQRHTPSALPAMKEGSPQDRLGLAQWLVDPAHPLTARVAVNRFWQQLFGIGLVKTAEDFGAQGEWPSHPQLLDWLAVDFRERGWDVKQLMKQLVTSATYRQASA